MLSAVDQRDHHRAGEEDLGTFRPVHDQRLALLHLAVELGDERRETDDQQGHEGHGEQHKDQHAAVAELRDQGGCRCS